MYKDNYNPTTGMVALRLGLGLGCDNMNYALLGIKVSRCYNLLNTFCFSSVSCKNSYQVKHHE